MLNFVAHASGSEKPRNFYRSFLFLKQEWGVANLIATPHSYKRASCSVKQMIKLQA